MSSSPGAGKPVALEVWGGLECTVNRVKDRFYNQIERSGHDRRRDDLERIASLGIRTVRYPILWELAARAGGAFDWTWADERLALLRDLDIEPVVGLVHHGSGPRYTNLTDSSFAVGLAHYAGQLAERFPWVQWYTPINEPLTTARFSGLYGLWYPHGRDNATFATALVNQCRATVMSMQAIRAVNPDAKLLQTDDLGQTSSTPRMQRQADFDNERRWLAWDLLCGTVTPDHALYDFLLSSGIQAAELSWFNDNPCPPSFVGINHYVTSDRFLDECCEAYPPVYAGSNGRVRYADVDSVRVAETFDSGWVPLLEAAWRRYRIPLVMSEVHLGCTREEQLRWFDQAWSAASTARAGGVDVRAVTAWALLGGFDWDSLLTADNGYYEPGAFDVRGPLPRVTALGKHLRNVAAGDASRHPVLESPGWWNREQRRIFTSGHGSAGHSKTRPVKVLHARARPLLICGAGGSLGQAFVLACQARGLEYQGCSREQLDICDPRAMNAVLNRANPWAIVNAAGYSRVVPAEHDADRCYAENAEGAGTVASAAARRSIPLLTFSSHLVFDGLTNDAYVEGSPVSPLSVYGKSKVSAESNVTRSHPGALCVRTASLFGARDGSDFLSRGLRILDCGGSLHALDDVTLSPTFIPDLVNASLDLLIDGAVGVWHLANPGAVSHAELFRLAAATSGVDSKGLQPRTREETSLHRMWPGFSVLGTERGILLPPLADALARYGAQSPTRGIFAPWRRAALG